MKKPIIILVFTLLLSSLASHKSEAISSVSMSDPMNIDVTPPLPISYTTDLITNLKPEPSIAVGETTIAIAKNSEIVGYTKENPGRKLYSIDFKSLFPKAVNAYVIGDPVVIYNRASRQYVLIALSFDRTHQESYILIAVSQSDLPRQVGDWCVYYSDATVFGTAHENNYADRIFAALNPSGYLYLTMTMYDLQDIFQYIKLRILDASEIRFHCGESSGVRGMDIKNLQNSTGQFIKNLTPAQRYDPGPPYFVSMPSQVNATTPITYLDYFVFENILEPPSVPNYQTYQIALDQPFFPSTVVRQPGPPNLFVRSDIIFQAEVRGNTLWFVHEMSPTGTNGSPHGIRHYKLDRDTSVINVITRSDNQYDYSLGSITTNVQGNAIVTFNASSPDPTTGSLSIRYADFFSPSNLIVQGTGIFTATAQYGNQWGDYALSSPDPDDTNFWLTHIYAKNIQGLTHPVVYIASTKPATPYIWKTFIPLERVWEPSDPYPTCQLIVHDLIHPTVN